MTSGKRLWSNDSAIPGQDYEYEFDAIGNRIGAETNERPATYTPNSVNEITQRTVPGALDIIGQANPAATITINNLQATRGENGYFYKELRLDNSNEPVWEIITTRAVLGSVPPGGLDTVVQQTGNSYLQKTPEAFTYDDDGNMTSDGRWNISWDGENRAISFEAIGTVAAAAKKKIERKYDSRGRRTEKKVYHWSTSAYVLTSTIRYLHDVWNLVAETDGSDILLRSYRWGLDLSGSIHGVGGVGGLLAVSTHESALQIRLISYDGNGNVLNVVDPVTVSIGAEFLYSPYGECIAASGSFESDCLFRFSTKLCDMETGFYDYGHRFYSPSIGRWLSRDPIEENGGVNLYAIALNNCISLYDINGTSVGGGPKLDFIPGVPAEGKFGFAMWLVNWRLSAPPSNGGQIIQKVTMEYSLTDCNGKPIPPDKAPARLRKTMIPGGFKYTESWPVFSGKKVPAYNGVDMFMTGAVDELPKAHGRAKITGVAQFHPDPVRSPKNFAAGAVIEAGGLPSALGHIDVPGGTGEVTHILEVEWDGCKGDGITKILQPR